MQNKDYQILLGFLVTGVCVCGFFFFFISFFLSRIGGVLEILSISINYFLLWLAAVLSVFADEGHSNTPQEMNSCEEQMSLKFWLRETAPQ